MLNVPHHYQPTTWAEYYQHDNQVKRVKQWIIDSPKGLPRAIFVSGHSGCGKTSLVMLLIKSVHCTERKDNEPDPCGKCDSCKSIDARLSDRSFSNVHWVQPGGFSEETVQASVKNALSAGARGPTNSKYPDKDVLFLVFDEWHKIDSRSRQQVLIRSEVETDQNVCYIFITMMQDQLPPMDRVAIQARCQCINLLPISPVNIVGFLRARVKPRDPLLTEEAMKVIARYSEGSLRMALTIYSAAKAMDEHVTDDVAYECVQAGPNWLRKELWEMVERSDMSAYALRERVEQLLMVCSNEKLAKQLQGDLLLADGATHRWEALKLLANYRNGPNELADIVAMMKVLGVRGVSMHTHSEGPKGSSEVYSPASFTAD